MKSSDIAGKYFAKTEMSPSNQMFDAKRQSAPDVKQTNWSSTLRSTERHFVTGQDTKSNERQSKDKTA